MEAHLYEELARQEDSHWWYHGRRAVIRSVLQRRLPAGPRKILDVGCGTGGMLKLLGEFGQVEGLEGSDDAIRLIRQRHGDSVTIRKGFIPDDIPQRGEYDVVTAFDVLEHLDDPVAAIRAIRGALRPGGVFVAAVPAFKFLWSEHDEVHHHRRRYTEASLRQELAEGGLDVEWVSYFNTLLFPPIAAARLLGKLRKGGGGEGAKSQLQDAPSALNGVLGALFATERLVVPRLKLPVGVSLLAVGRAGAPS